MSGLDQAVAGETARRRGFALTEQVLFGALNGLIDFRNISRKNAGPWNHQDSDESCNAESDPRRGTEHSRIHPKVVQNCNDRCDDRSAAKGHPSIRES
jgi:hypothetical protein